MATFAINNHLAFPSFLDVNGGQGVGMGRTMLESSLKTWALGGGGSRILSGFACPTNAGSAGLTGIVIKGGKAVINGVLISGDPDVAAATINLDASSTYTIWIQLTEDGSGDVSGCQFLVEKWILWNDIPGNQASGSGVNYAEIPQVANCVKIGTVETNASGILLSKDTRPMVPGISGTYAGTDDISGAQPRFIPFDWSAQDALSNTNLRYKEGLAGTARVMAITNGKIIAAGDSTVNTIPYVTLCFNFFNMTTTQVEPEPGANLGTVGFKYVGVDGTHPAHLEITSAVPQLVPGGFYTNGWDLYHTQYDYLVIA